MAKLLLFTLPRVLFISALLFTTVGCDQVTKIVARDALQHHPGYSFLGDTMRLQYAVNTGAFLNLGAGLSEHMRFLVFNVFTAIFLIGAIIVLFRPNMQGRYTTIALTLVIAGGVGNLIDRILYGYVIDFMNLGIGSLRTGIFNVADMAISAGVLMMLVENFQTNKKAL